MTGRTHQFDWRLDRIVPRLTSLEETNSFLAAVITDPVTVGSEWVTFDSYVAGPTNFEIAVPDMAIAEDGSGIRIINQGSYFCACNFHLLDPSGDGEVEAAVQPIGICTPQWPDDDVNKGHQTQRVDADRFGWSNYTPGYSPAPVLVPCLVDDIITPSIKYSSADGTETLDVKGLLYVWKVTQGSQVTP